MSAPSSDADEIKLFSSKESALPVPHVEAEYAVVMSHARAHYGMDDAFPSRQRLLVEGKRAFDVLCLDLPDGSVREYWFDVSSFYRFSSQEDSIDEID